MNNGKDLFQFVSLQDMLNCPLGNFKENMNLNFIKKKKKFWSLFHIVIEKQLK